MALDAKNHHVGNMVVRPFGSICDFPQAGSAQPLCVDFIRSICALRFDPARAVGNRKLPSQSADWQSR